jgi:hypothetical protein
LAETISVAAAGYLRRYAKKENESELEKLPPISTI